MKLRSIGMRYASNKKKAAKLLTIQEGTIMNTVKDSFRLGFIVLVICFSMIPIYIKLTKANLHFFKKG